MHIQCDGVLVGEDSIYASFTLDFSADFPIYVSPALSASQQIFLFMSALLFLHSNKSIHSFIYFSHNELGSGSAC